MQYLGHVLEDVAASTIVVFSDSSFLQDLHELLEETEEELVNRTIISFLPLNFSASSC
jgi:hypothetical protein